MIDYQKHRERLKRGSLKVIEPGEDYGNKWLHDAQRAQQELFEDIEVILDKAEKWDKYQINLTTEGTNKTSEERK